MQYNQGRTKCERDYGHRGKKTLPVLLTLIRHHERNCGCCLLNPENFTGLTPTKSQENSGGHKHQQGHAKINPVMAWIGKAASSSLLLFMDVQLRSQKKKKRKKKSQKQQFVWVHENIDKNLATTKKDLSLVIYLCIRIWLKFILMSHSGPWRCIFICIWLSRAQYSMQLGRSKIPKKPCLLRLGPKYWLKIFRLQIFII